MSRRSLTLPTVLAVLSAVTWPSFQQSESVRVTVQSVDLGMILMAVRFNVVKAIVISPTVQLVIFLTLMTIIVALIIHSAKPPE